MPIQFFNTLSGKIDQFQPLKAGEVRLYTCGPTVYDFAHIGNLRAFMFEDLLRRFLEFSGYKVHHVMNLTDVDDKTIAGAHQEKKPLEEYTAKYIQAFQEDLKTLNILPPTEQPRATREIEGKGGMIPLIQTLLDKGIAYVSDGSVYYRVSKFPAYGKLSKKKLDQNIAGAGKRVDVDEYDKEQVSDFVLWKKSKEGEPCWNSPWGPGRPGWHIECSSMSMKYLGETFDIHAGGEDLIFPHHENEIAQSEGATGKPFVKYWLHCKFLLVNGEKMSKSKGNFYTLRDLLAKGYDPMAIRYALIATHYRSPLNFTLEGLKECSEIIKKLDDCYSHCLSLSENSEWLEPDASNTVDFHDFINKLHKPRIADFLADDLNVSAAFAELFDVISFINASLKNQKIDRRGFKVVLEFFRQMDQLFGFDITAIRKIPNQINDKLNQLAVFRKEKQFQKADHVRAELKELGWLIKDGRPGEPSIVKQKRRVWDV